MLRQDPVTGRWVIIARNRADRPYDFASSRPTGSTVRCPFCVGNEDLTPAEIAVYPANADSATWQVRVIPNRYPALVDDAPESPAPGGIYRSLRGVGIHEVIVESPDHVASLTELTERQLAWTFTAYRDRIAALGADGRLAYALVFKNVGPAAGASLHHSHSQLIATPIVPIIVREELSGSESFFNSHRQCIYCRMIEQESDAGHRIVAQSDHFVAFCPFAARFPFETWILPRAHRSRFERTDSRRLAECASLVQQVVARIESVLDRAAYNYLIHSAPFDTGRLGHYHWHVEVFPRLTKAAGFEWGTGYYINPVPPEDAAEHLRAADV